MVPEANRVRKASSNIDKNPDHRVTLNRVKKARPVQLEHLVMQAIKAIRVNKAETEIKASKVLLVNRVTPDNQAKMAAPDPEEIMVKMRTLAKKAIQARPDNADMLAQPVLSALKVLKVILARQAIPVIKVHKDVRARMVRPVNVARLVNLVNVAHPLI